MSFKPINQVKVELSFGEDVLLVGKLAFRNKKIYFEYDASFLERGLAISPIECSIRSGVRTFNPFLFDGLPGVFNDSLPDGWGRLLLDRKMRLKNVLPNELSPLDRLAHVGKSGMGALIYEPDHTDEYVLQDINLSVLADHAEQILEGATSDILQELISLNGSSGGARPKAIIGVHKDRQSVIHGAHTLADDFESWLVKFPSFSDMLDIGAVEYVYALMAVKAGIEMDKVHLFPAKKGAGYFATRRFDRKGNKRFHMHSACGLLHSDFRDPSLDYKDLIKLTMYLTKDIREAEKMYRLAVFNVLAHNRDDHSKNFNFLMDKTGQWRLSPAYDLTFAEGLRGEHCTMVKGAGKNPKIADLVKLGLDASLKKAAVLVIIEQTREALGSWRDLASQYSVAKKNIDLIEAKMKTVSG